VTRWRGLDVEAEGTGISRPLSEQINLLGALLGQAIRDQAGDGTLELVEELRLACKRAAQEGDPGPRRLAAETIARLDLPRILWLLRAFTTFFHLVNQAEKQEIVRINRERSRAPGEDGAPRPESIDDAVGRLARAGLGREDVCRLFGRLDVQPTFTAHPTEARRRTVLRKQQRISGILAELGGTAAGCEPTPAERETLLDRLSVEIALLLATDDVPAERPTVRDEVEQGLYFLRGSVWETVPRIHRDAELALRRHFGEDGAAAGGGGALPVFLRLRSWIGSDRDGNPNVTPEVTRWTVARHRRRALDLLAAELRELEGELSLSDRQVPVPDALRERLEDEPAGDGQRAHEPYRRFVARMIAHLEALVRQAAPYPGSTVGCGLPHQSGGAETRGRPEGYTLDRLLADLRLLEHSLDDTGFAEVAHHGRLRRVRVLADVRLPPRRARRAPAQPGPRARGRGASTSCRSSRRSRT
jgi:phosphoenolpyruvate carboxylase